MKGIVFTEFMDMVDDKFGFEVTEKIISSSDLPSGGVYTSVGSYAHDEIVALVVSLSKETNIAVPDLVKTFGSHLLGRFYDLFPSFFDECDNVNSFLSNVDGYIHGEVRKLYPDATLPKIEATPISETELELIYSSPRGMGDLAEGLIAGAMEHFSKKHNHTHKMTREDLPYQDEVQFVKFSIHVQAQQSAA